MDAFSYGTRLELCSTLTAEINCYILLQATFMLTHFTTNAASYRGLYHYSTVAALLFVTSPSPSVSRLNCLVNGTRNQNDLWHDMFTKCINSNKAMTAEKLAL